MKAKSKVSVIIPVYNGADFLSQAIESVLHQTYQNCEIIVVNDGSTDNGKTKEIALSYADKIRYIEKSNGGVASALNCGIQNMQGEYFAWLSHDDIFTITKIERQMEAILNAGDNMVISVGNYCLCNIDLQQKVATNFEKYFPRNYIERSLFLFFWGELHFSSLLFHKRHFERVGLFREDLITAQDNDFLFRLLRGQRIAFVSDIVSLVRLHSSSGTSRLRSCVNAENCKVYLSMLQQLSIQEMLQFAPTSNMVYNKIGGIIKSMGGKKEIQIIEQLRKKCMRDFGFIQDYDCLQKQSLVIFGAGQYGIRLKYELNQNKIYPICFLDNAIEKSGIWIDGIPCYQPNFILDHEQYIVIIAQKFYADSYKQLQQMGHTHILLKQDIDKILLQAAISYQVE